MLRYILVFAGLVCETPSIAAPFLTIDNPVQHIAPGGAAFFSGLVVFDMFMPLGAEPALSPTVPSGFSFAPALALAGPFGAGEIYSGPLFVVFAPEDATPQVYSALLTVGGTTNAVAITLSLDAVPEPGTFGLIVAAVLTAVLRRKVQRRLG